ncbi:OsmC family protein [Deltaproteobacteria bacterium PRO3]|nr:OsmC family protein [Deltaproteobacteria bacterium PRO3]
MVKIDLQYQGDLRVAAEHAPSGTRLHTDAPVDNQGKGESFSPTDLVATGLGSCMATIMGIVSRKHGIDLKGMEIRVEKIMSQEGPRRIAALEVDFQIPLRPDDEKVRLLEEAAHTCPVALSIHPDIQVRTRFRWGNDAPSERG